MYFLFQFVILITIIIDETSVLAVISFLLAFTIYLLRFYILFCDSAILNSFTQFLFARVWTLLIGTRKKTEKIEEIKAVLQSKGEPDWSNCCQFYMEKVAKLWEKKWKHGHTSFGQHRRGVWVRKKKQLWVDFVWSAGLPRLLQLLHSLLCETMHVGFHELIQKCISQPKHYHPGSTLVICSHCFVAH